MLFEDVVTFPYGEWNFNLNSSSKCQRFKWKGKWIFHATFPLPSVEINQPRIFLSFTARTALTGLINSKWNRAVKECTLHLSAISGRWGLRIKRISEVWISYKRNQAHEEIGLLIIIEHLFRSWAKRNLSDKSVYKNERGKNCLSTPIWSKQNEWVVHNYNLRLVGKEILRTGKCLRRRRPVWKPAEYVGEDIWWAKQSLSQKCQQKSLIQSL